MPNRGPQEYLALAQQAERSAEEAQGPLAKQHFLAIAHEYRALAAEKLRRMQDDRLSQSPTQGNLRQLP